MPHSGVLPIGSTGSPLGNLMDRSTITNSFIPSSSEVQKLKDARFEVENQKSGEKDQRSPGQKDYDRILYSHAFLRLGGVTQILPPTASLPRLHNRLTHSLKVAQMARSIAQNVIAWAVRNEKVEYIKSLGGIDADVAAAAGLAHDLGHPPFGHAGEAQLDRLTYSRNGKDIVTETRSGFEGNAQTFRIAVKLEASHGAHAGLRFTAGTRAAILKYPWRREDDGSLHSKKFGYYNEDKEEFELARKWLKPGEDGYPGTSIGDGEQTLEASIMDLADDISYAVHDLEDFLSLGVIRSSTILFHCQNYLNQDKERFNPLVDFARDLEQDYPRRFSAEMLQDACRFMLAQYLPHNDAEPEHVRFWRNKNIEEFLDGIELLDAPRGDKSARVDFNDQTWHRVELFKFFAKQYVIRRSETALLQRSGDAILKNTLMALLEWGRSNPPKYAMPNRLWLAEKWRKQLGNSHAGRHYLDFICMLSDMELVELHSALTGGKLPQALRFNQS